MNRQADFETAVGLLEAGRFEDALRIGKTLLRAEKKSEMLLQFCGTCALNQGDLKDAKKYYSKLVQFYPKIVKYWSDLGYVHFSTDDFTRARHAYGQAARREPGNPDHIIGDARCRVSEGDLQGAGEQYARALAVKSDHPGALHGLANVRREQSRALEAMVYLRQLSEIVADSSADFWVEYAELAFSTSDIPETLRAVENAQSIGLHDADLEARIAILYSQMGRSETATDCIERAIALAPDDIEVLNDAASVFIDAGDSKAATETFRKIIAREPGLAKIYYSMCQLRSFSSNVAEDAEFITEMENALNNNPDDPALLHFGLGKAYADLGEVDKAFHHLTIGNVLRKADRPYSLQRDEDRVQKIKQQFPAGSVAQHSGPVRKDTLSPIFIVGMPRSGTTLVEQIIGAHPEVTPCGELSLLSHTLSSTGQSDAAEQLPQSWEEIGALYRTRISGLADGKMRTTDKMPHNFFNVGAIWSAMPDARVILLQRNPMDIGLSCYQACFNAGLDFSHDLAAIGGFYRLFEDVCAHWKKIAPGRLLELRYEDLVQDTDTNIRRMLAFCELEYHSDCERYFENHRRLGTASFNQANKPIYQSSVEKWRRYETHLQPLIETLAS